MISFRIGDEFLHAPQGTRLRIRFVSPAPFPGQDPEIVIPISLPVTFPDNPHNRRLLKYGNQLNNAAENKEIACTLYFDGTPLFPGFLMPAGPTDSDFRMSFVYDTLQQKGETMLKDMDLGDQALIEGTFDAKMQDLNDPASPVRVFPIWNEKFCQDWQPASPIMEIHKFQNFLNDSNEFEFYDGWPAVTPFLRVQFLIKKISEFLFLYDHIIETEFFEDLLSELVLYSNNSIVDSDTLIASGTTVLGDTFNIPDSFPLASQSPDQNIADFLLHFGLYFCGGFFFNINYSKATFRHMADVIKQQPSRDWTNYMSHSYELPVGDRYFGAIVADPRGNEITGSQLNFDTEFINVRAIMFAPTLYPGFEAGKPFTAYIQFLALSFLIKPGSDIFEFYYIRKLNYDNISRVEIDSSAPEIKIQAGALHNWAPTFDESLIPDSQVYSRPVPVIESKGHLQNIQDGDEIDPIFMFYRGIVTTSMTDPDNHFQEINFDYHSGSALSYAPGGPFDLGTLLNSATEEEKTLYKHLWRPWNDHLRANKVVKAQFKLPLREILNFSFDQVIRAGNMNYLLKSLEVVLSDRGVEPCVAEMVGCAQAGLESLSISGIIYTGGVLVEGVTTRKYDGEGNVILNLNHGASVIDLDFDSSGNIYTSGNRIGEVTTRKYDSAGNLILSLDHGAVVNAITIDNSRNIYTGGGVIESVTTRKYDSAGNLLFSLNHGAAVLGIAVDSLGSIYTVGSRFDAVTTRKYDSAGNLLFSLDHGAVVRGIAVDSSGNIYTVGTRVGDVTTRKYDSAGNLLWSRDHGAQANNLAVDSDGNLYTIGLRVGEVTTRKYDSAGNLILSLDHGANGFAIAIDSTGNIYTTGFRFENVTTKKYDSAGNLLFSLDHGASVLCIKV